MAKNELLKKDSMLGPYRIVRLIGEGGMGEVYEAVDGTLHRPVAIKVISHKLMGDEIFVKRFLAEGKTLARLNHQNVVSVYALGEERGIHYIVMEYIDGKPLDKVRQSRTLSVEEVVAFVKQILAGVRALHESGIIHRDLKPKNILVCNDGGLKIVDFGVAKTDGHSDPEITSAGMLVGSVSYVAPEIVTGQPASFQSDIWSTGIIFYELLYGLRPFSGDNPLAVLDKIKTQPLKFPTGRRSEAPEALRKIIAKMCEKAYSRRYPTVDDILYDLAVYENKRTGRATSPAPSAQIPRAARSVRRGGWVNALVGIGALAAAWFYFGPKTQQAQPTRVVKAPKKIVAPSPKLVARALAPVSGQEVWLSKGEPLRIEWTGAVGQGVILQVATDKGFKDIAAEVKHPASGAQSVDLPVNSLYHWRLVQQKPGARMDELVAPISFYVSAREGPELQLPETESKFENPTDLAFSWEDVGGIKKYRFLLSSDKDFQTVFKDMTVNEHRTEISNLPAGFYYWRVTSVGNPALTNVWSETRVFQVVEKPVIAKSVPKVQRRAVSSSKLPIAPAIAKTSSVGLLIYKPGVDLNLPESVKQSLKRGPLLQWKKSRLATSYEVEIASSADFSQVEWSQVTTSDQVRWGFAVPGTYFWRVRALGVVSEKSAFSKIAKLSLKLPAPKMKGSISRTMSSIGAGTKEVPLSWEAVPGASYYKLVVSSSKRFDKIVSHSTHDQSSAELQLKDGRNYFVKVAALSEDGRQLSDFSAPTEIKLNPPKASAASKKKIKRKRKAN